MSGKIVKNIDNSKLSKRKKQAENRPYNGNICSVPKPLKISSDSAVLVEGEYNCGIELTGDFGESLFEGYGARGHHKSSTIDLVAGRMSKFSKDDFYVDNNYEHDASRIYISEKTDIDKRFKLRGDKLSLGKSAIGIKSDHIRIIGGEGIKLISTPYKNLSSVDSTVPTVRPSGVEIIALNSNSSAFDIQPMVKGDNLRDFLDEMVKNLATLSGILEENILYQSKVNKLLHNHDHAFFIGGYPFPTSTPAYGKSPEDFIKKTREVTKAEKELKSKVKNFYYKINELKRNYLDSQDEKYICSKLNKVN